MGWIRDLSLILLAIEMFVLFLLPLALCGGLVYALWHLRRRDRLPAWLQLARAYLSLGLAYIELAMASIARPILAVHTATATAQGWLGGIANRTKGGEK